MTVAVSYPLIVGPYSSQDTERLTKLLDAVFEYVTGDENSFFPRPDLEEHRRLTLGISNSFQFFTIFRHDSTVKDEVVEQVTGILRGAYWI